MQTYLEQGTFRLAFVGMSNAGKSHRSRRLRDECDFMWYEVDQHIANKLGLADVSAVGEWMGEPTEAGYQEKEQEYARMEEACTHLHHLDTQGKNLVFDTTGSVIYVSPQAQDWLHSQCLVVHIDVGEQSIEKMTNKYLADPKPVAWDGWLEQLDNESDEEALRRCYPLLLRDRLVKYRAFAHISIPVAELYDTPGEEALRVIKTYLPE